MPLEMWLGLYRDGCSTWNITPPSCTVAVARALATRSTVYAEDTHRVRASIG